MQFLHIGAVHQTWDFDYGEPFTWATEDYLLRELSPDYVSGLTLLGVFFLEFWGHRPAVGGRLSLGGYAA